MAPALKIFQKQGMQYYWIFLTVHVDVVATNQNIHRFRLTINNIQAIQSPKNIIVCVTPLRLIKIWIDPSGRWTWHKATKQKHSTDQRLTDRKCTPGQQWLLPCSTTAKNPERRVYRSAKTRTIPCTSRAPCSLTTSLASLVLSSSSCLRQPPVRRRHRSC